MNPPPRLPRPARMTIGLVTFPAVALLIALPGWSQQQPKGAGDAAKTPPAAKSKNAPAAAPAPAQEPAPDPALSAPVMLSPVQEARDLVEVLEARVEIKKAELREAEVHLNQARRRLAAILLQQRAEYQRAVDRLRWAENMHKKGYYTDAQLRADRQRVAELDPRAAATNR